MWLDRRKQRFRPVVKMKRKVGQGGKLILFYFFFKKEVKDERGTAPFLQLLDIKTSQQFQWNIPLSQRRYWWITRCVFIVAWSKSAAPSHSHALRGFVIKIHWAFGKDCKSPRSFSNISCLLQSKGAGRNHHVCGEFERWLGCYGLPFRAVYSLRLI